MYYKDGILQLHHRHFMLHSGNELLRQIGSPEFQAGGVDARMAGEIFLLQHASHVHVAFPHFYYQIVDLFIFVSIIDLPQDILSASAAKGIDESTIYIKNKVFDDKYF